MSTSRSQTTATGRRNQLDNFKICREAFGNFRANADEATSIAATLDYVNEKTISGGWMRRHGTRTKPLSVQTAKRWLGGMFHGAEGWTQIADSLLAPKPAKQGKLPIQNGPAPTATEGEEVIAMIRDAVRAEVAPLREQVGQLVALFDRVPDAEDEDETHDDAGHVRDEG